MPGKRRRDLRNGFGLPIRITPSRAADLPLHPAWTLATLRAGLPRFANLERYTPAGQNVQSLPAVLDIAARHHAFVVDDDWARDFALDGEPPPLLAADERHGHVVYLRSLTKCAAPSLRVGALCARGPAAARLRAARLVDDFFVPGPLQETALQLVTAAAWPRHLRALRVALRRNRDLLACALLADPAAALEFALPAAACPCGFGCPKERGTSRLPQGPVRTALSSSLAATASRPSRPRPTSG